MEDDDDFGSQVAGEDGMGLAASQAGVWDEMLDVAEAEQEDGLEGDDIENWD